MGEGILEMELADYLKLEDWTGWFDSMLAMAGCLGKGWLRGFRAGEGGSSRRSCQ